MDLIGDSWIPVVDARGTHRLVGLAELYQQAHTIRDLAATPPQRVALMRLLLCITQAALGGPPDEKAWLACRPDIPSTSLAYLATRHDRFALYGPAPFLQVPSLEPKGNASLDKLDFGLPAGHGPTLYDHGARPEGRPRSPAWSALMLLTYQCFSPGGLVGDNRWGDTATGRSSQHAPCVEESLLHAFLRGPCLLDSIHLNLVTREMVAGLPNSVWGAPSWDLQLTDPSCPHVATATSSYLGRLVPMPRAILLEADSPRFTLANGLSYPKLPPWREPCGTVVLRGSGAQQRHAYLKTDLSRHPWRELGSVLALGDGVEQSGPVALRHLLAITHTLGTVDLWTGGLVADQAKLIDFGEWVFALPVALLADEPVRKYRQGVDEAERGAAALRRATAAYRDAFASGHALDEPAQVLYWSHLDAASPQLLHAATVPGSALDGQWLSLIERAARTAYDQTCARVTPRQVQAYVAGLRHLPVPRPSSMPYAPEPKEVAHAAH